MVCFLSCRKDDRSHVHVLLKAVVAINRTCQIHDTAHCHLQLLQGQAASLLVHVAEAAYH